MGETDKHKAPGLRPRRVCPGGARRLRGGILTRRTRGTWRFTLAGAVVGLACIDAARADTIDFGQFGPEYTTLPNTISGVTVDGVGFTITGVGQGFTRMDSASAWGAPISEFSNGAKLLVDFYAPYFNYPSPPSPGPATVEEHQRTLGAAC